MDVATADEGPSFPKAIDTWVLLALSDKAQLKEAQSSLVNEAK